jgi:hypothetical protein
MWYYASDLALTFPFHSFFLLCFKRLSYMLLDDKYLLYHLLIDWK